MKLLITMTAFISLLKKKKILSQPPQRGWENILGRGR